MKFLLAVILFLSGAAGAPAAELVVIDLLLVDPVLRETRPASLHLVDGRVAAEGPPDGSTFAPHIERWSAAGRYAVPAFFDTSVFVDTQVSPGHRDELASADARLLFRAAGVKEVLDLSGRNDPGFARAAGPLLVAEGGVGAELPGAVGIVSAGDARRVIAGLLGTDAAPARISLIFDRGRNRRGLPPATLSAILEAAGPVPVAVYVGTWSDVHDALDAGARWLVQIPPGAVPAPILGRVRELRPLWTPAIAVGMDFMALMSDETLRDSSALKRALPAEMRRDYGEVRVPQGRLSEARLLNEERLKALVDLHAAGAQLVGGSQSGGLGTAHGWSLLRELEWWRTAGVDGWEILVAATSRPAGLLGSDSGFGPGAPADFNLYAASPHSVAGELFRPEIVFVGGEPIEPDQMAARVSHRLVEDIPENPLPGGSRWSLLLISVVGFAVLLFLRRLVRRAARDALDS